MQGEYYANVFVHFEPTGRRLEDIENDDMKYGSIQNPAGYQEGIQLPPYIVPDSPEAYNFIDYSPYGWELEVENHDDSDSDDEEEEELEEDDDGDEREEELEVEGGEDAEYYRHNYGEDENEEYYNSGEYYDEEGEDDEDSDEEEEYESNEDYDEREAGEHRTNHNDSRGPNCPSNYLESPAEAPAECRNRLPFHKRVVLHFQRIRNGLSSKANRSWQYDATSTNFVFTVIFSKANDTIWSLRSSAT